MKKSKNSFIILLCFGIIILIACLLTYFRDLDQDLDKADRITGRVVYMKPAYIRIGKKRERFISFELNNSAERFTVKPWIYQKDVERNLQPGDTVKVYYKHSNQYYNTQVYQIEKGKEILASYDLYNQTISEKWVMAVFAGLFLILLAFLQKKNLSLVNFLNSLVSVKKI